MSRLFNGSSDVCFVAAVAVNSYPATVSLWFKRNIAPGGPLSMFNLADTAASNNYVDNWINGASGGDPISGTVRTSGLATTMVAGAATTINTWQNLICVYNSSTDRTVYFNNGSSANSTTERAWPSGIDSMSIGALKTNVTGQWFSGRLAHVAVWNTALDATARTSLQTLTPNQVASASLQGYWAMTENQAMLIDSSANANHMTITGATFDADNPTLSSGGSAALLAYLFRSRST